MYNIRHVAVAEDGKHISVCKLKTIRKYDESGRNADHALVGINSTRYGVAKPNGSRFSGFSKNRQSKKALELEDRDVFPEGEARFTFGSHDKHNALLHVGRILQKNKRGNINVTSMMRVGTAGLPT